MEEKKSSLIYLACTPSIFDKEESYEDVKETLKKYKGILSNESFDYLEAISNLEISALGNDINEDERNLLSELDIYRKLVVYNIYNRTNNLLQKNKEFGNLIIDNGIISPSQELSVISKIDGKEIDIFNFDYSNSQNEVPYGYKVPSWYKNNGIGVINLYLTNENQELREQEILSLLREYEWESNKENPYGRSNKIGGPGSTWLMHHSRKLSKINKRFKELDERKSITDLDKKIIEIQQYYYSLLLENMGIDKQDFEDDEVKLGFRDRNMINNMNEKKVKRYPNLNVYSNINNL